jgi:pimeloyl-ACP methyl ester carboxylesterase
MSMTIRPIVFAHGLESGPIGRKSQALIDAGHQVIAPDCRGRDLAQRVQRLVEAIVAAERPPLLVGSSFGGIAGLVAALVAAERGVVVPGIVLCAPALMLPPPPGTVQSLGCPAPTIIVHGTRDEVIPIEGSRRFAREHGALLREVDDGHGLGHAGLVEILAAVRELSASP